MTVINQAITGALTRLPTTHLFVALYFHFMVSFIPFIKENFSQRLHLARNPRYTSPRLWKANIYSLFFAVPGFMPGWPVTRLITTHLMVLISYRRENLLSYREFDARLHRWAHDPNPENMVTRPLPWITRDMLRRGDPLPFLNIQNSFHNEMLSFFCSRTVPEHFFSIKLAIFLFRCASYDFTALGLHWLVWVFILVLEHHILNCYDRSFYEVYGCERWKKYYRFSSLIHLRVHCRDEIIFRDNMRLWHTAHKQVFPRVLRQMMIHRLWKNRQLLRDCGVRALSPQSGEWTKEDDKNLYIKRIKAIEVERKKNAVACLKEKGKKKKYKHQSGDAFIRSIVDLVTPWKEYYDKVAPEKRVMLNEVENIALTLYTLSDCRTLSGFAACFVLYLKTHLKDNLLTVATDYLADLIDPLQEQSLDDVMEQLRKGLRSWRDVRKLPMFSHVSDLVSLAVSVGMCAASDVEIELKGIKLFSVGVKKKTADAWDLVDAVMLAAEYFIDAGYESFKTKSLRPFLYESVDSQHLDDDYMACREAMQMFSNGNLAHCKIKSEAKLIEKLDDVYDRLDRLIRITPDKTASRILSIKRNEISDWRMDFLSKTNGGGLRKAPYTFIVWGASGVGKSAVMNNIISHLLVHRDEDPGDHTKIVTVNASDKYMSNVKSDTKVLIFDDMGAEGPDTADGNVARMWIDCSNNVRNYAVKADLIDKGKCGFNHEIQGGTSNARTGFMDLFCLYGAATARRGERFRTQIKPQFATDGRYDASKVRKVYNDSILPDVYDFTVEHAVEDVHNPGSYIWVVSEWEGTRLSKISYANLMEYVIAMYDQHMSEQTIMLKNMHAANASLHKCKQCNSINTLCNCQMPRPMEKQVGFIGHTVLRIFSNLFLGSLGFYEDWLSRLTTGQVLSLLSAFNCSWTSWWFTIVPEPIWRSTVMQRVIDNLVEYRVNMSLKWLSNITNGMYLFCMVAAGTAFAPVTNCIALAVLVQLTAASLAAASRRYIASKIAMSRYCVQGVVQATRTPFVIVGVLGAMFVTTRTILMLVRSTRKMQEQGILSPKTPEDMARRDEMEARRAKIPITPLPTVLTRTTVHEDLVALVFKNLLCVGRQETESIAVCNAFQPESNVVILPMHMVKEEHKEFTFARDPENPSTRFKAKLCLNDVQQIDNLDLVMCQVPMAPPAKNLTTYFCGAGRTEADSTLVYRNRKGEQVVGPILARADSVSVSKVVYKGYSYDAPYNTFKGLCMATVVGNKAVPMILGFHTAGNEGTPEGFASPITWESYSRAKEKLFSKHPSMLPANSDGGMNTVYFGKDSVAPGAPLHLKSPVVETDGPVLYFGGCGGRVTPRSAVIPTKIAADVTEVCGVKQEWGAPKMGREAWVTGLMHARSPGIGFETEYADLAVKDMKEQVGPIFKPPFKVVPILTNVQIVSGMDSVAFIGGMEGSTSPGYGGAGPKRQLFIDLEPDEEHACPRTFPDEIWDEVAFYEQEYLAGRRCYPIFKACLKDEPTPVEKEKVRIFQGAPLVAQCLLRKYFLPIARQMSMHPLTSETAVGINPYGPEWDEMNAYVTKFGTEAILAGDYAKYDLTMPAQLTAAAFKLLIDWAEMSGNYTPEEIKIMRGIATDIIYPTIAYNGDLIMLLGSTPSGHNLTVYINSLCGALLLRMGFYATTGLKDAKFSDYCAMITYGDDFWGSVREDIRDLFNFVTFQKFLADNGMTLTMPDKTSAAIPFLDHANCDFLKRSTRYSEELECHVGALAEMSIFKSLKSVLKSKVLGENEQSAVNIDTALREWFFHGREVFEKRQEEMIIIAERRGLVHLIPELYTSFDTRVAEWKKKYR